MIEAVAPGGGRAGRRRCAGRSMLRGDLGDVAAAPCATARPAWPAFRLEVGRPILPMLAQTAAGRRPPRSSGWAAPRSSGSSTASGSRCTEAATTSAVFTRTLDDITARVPEVVEAVLRAAGSRRRCSTARRSRSPPTAARCRSR